MIRKYTNKIIEMAEEGIIGWEDIARAALNHMSEDKVRDMAYDNMFLEDEDEDEDECDACECDACECDACECDEENY